MGEKEIDISLYHRTIRISEHEHIAKLLRKKSKVMIAFGTCACSGGVPGLCNLFSREEIFEACYRDTPSTINTELTASLCIAYLRVGAKTYHVK